MAKAIPELCDAAGDTCVYKVMDKMNELYKQHIDGGNSEKVAVRCVFEYGRPLIGFDICWGWAMAKGAKELKAL